MRASKCDGCGRFYEQQDVREYLKGQEFAMLSVQEIYPDRDKNHKYQKKDLCPECLGKIMDVIYGPQDNAQEG